MLQLKSKMLQLHTGTLVIHLYSSQNEQTQK